MYLKDIKREKGKVHTLYDLLRVLFDVYKKDIFKNGSFIESARCYILPTCILISKMFSMQVAYDELENKYFIYLKNKCIDVEKLICNIEEDEDLPFPMADLCEIDSAVVVSRKCNITPVSKLLQNPKTKTCYDNIISRIDMHLKSLAEKYTYSRYNIQGSQIRKIHNYSYNDTCGFEEDDGEDDEYQENRYYTKSNDIYEDERGCFRESRNVDISKVIEEDYDINLDDVESDYYEVGDYE